MNKLEKLFEEAQSHEFVQFLEKDKKLVIRGAGEWGCYIIKDALEFNLPVKCIVDDGMRDEVEGIPVLKSDDFFKSEDSSNYKFIIASYRFAYDILMDLQNRGVDRDNIYVPQRGHMIRNPFGSIFAYRKSFFSVLDFLRNKEHYFNVYNHLADEDSKEIFVAIMRFRMFGDYDNISMKLLVPDEFYFQNANIKLGEHESFVDVGAFDGDSIIDFLQKTENMYDKIYAIEGNSNMCESLKKKLALEYQRGKIELMNVGVGEKRGQIIYNGMMTGCGEEIMEIYKMDDLLGEKKVSLIKMDIEGMELQAINGAEKIIKTQKPKLAICVYHLIRDIWEIQERLMELVPQYKFYLEQPVSQCMHETVLYAIL